MAKNNKNSFVQRNKRELIIAGVILLVVIGLSYAWLTQTINDSKNNVIVGGSLQLTLSNEDPIIKIGGTYGYAVPLSDADGNATTPYSFTLTNNGEVPVTYSFYLDPVDSYKDANDNTVSITSATRIDNSKIKYSLLSGIGNLSGYNQILTSYCTTGNTYSGNSSSLNIITYAFNNDCNGVSQTIQPGQSINYQLRIWINSSAVNSDVYDEATSTNKAFAAKLRVEAQQYYDAAYSNSPYNSGY